MKEREARRSRTATITITTPWQCLHVNFNVRNHVARHKGGQAEAMSYIP
jgi:hypothetical protein